MPTNAEYEEFRTGLEMIAAARETLPEMFYTEHAPLMHLYWKVLEDLSQAQTNLALFLRKLP